MGRDGISKPSKANLNKETTEKRPWRMKKKSENKTRKEERKTYSPKSSPPTPAVPGRPETADFQVTQCRPDI